MAIAVWIICLQNNYDVYINFMLELLSPVKPIPLLLSIDINECELEGDDCHMYATCTDTFGSFECTCNSGFEGDGVNCTSMYMSLKIFCAKLN